MSVLSARQENILKFLSHPFWDIQSVSESALALYDQALTHDSYANEQRDRGLASEHYQRLEFLGDRILNHAIAEFLFHSYATDAQGTLTDKAKFTNNENLAHLAKAKGLGIHPPIVRLSRGQNLEDSIIADVFEALIAAIYLDPDYGMAKIHEIIQKQLADDVQAFCPEHENPKGDLQTFIQQGMKVSALGTESLDYVVIEHETTANNGHRFVVEVRILGVPWGRGKGSRKGDAEKAAARAALSKIETGDSPF
jgi:ribonuclease-3